ncbi:MAG TPA: phosphotransferase [Acidimicrobiia bacterium]
MSAAAWEPERPAAPDPDLLRRAAASLDGPDGSLDSEATRWEILGRIERPRSTLFLLRAHRVEAAAPTDAYYKVSHPPPYTGERRERWVATVRSGLIRSMELEQRLAALVAGEGITFARALAVDPDVLAVVTLAVAGEAMGKVWRHALTREARAGAVGPLILAGRAARLIEQCTTDPVEPEGPSQSAVDRRLARVDSILPPATMQRLERRMAELESGMMDEPLPMVYCHGDFSSTNLLLDGDRIGLIDFTWPLRQRGFDLAHFAFRIEYDTAIPPAMTAPLLAALIEGYGDPDVTGRPGYRFVRLSKLLKVLEDQRSWSSRGRRARAEIEAEVG